MAEYIATRTIKRDGKYISPNEPVNVTGKEAEDLLKSGAIKEKGADEAEAVSKPVAENTAPRLPASGETSPSKPDDVAKDAKASGKK